MSLRSSRPRSRHPVDRQMERLDRIESRTADLEQSIRSLTDRLEARDRREG